MGKLERRLRDKERRIAEIIGAAKKIFQIKGFASATMNDIADSSELSRRTLYLYFNRKEELLLSVAAQGLNSLVEQLEACSCAEGPALERIRKLFNHIVGTFIEDAGSFRFILSYGEGVKAVGQNHELVIACRSAMTHLQNSITAILKQGAEDGSIRHFDDPLAASRTILLMVGNSIETSVDYADIVQEIMGDDPVVFLKNVFNLLATYLASERTAPIEPRAASS